MRNNKIKVDDLIYSIDEEKNEAVIINNEIINDLITIPRSITYLAKEYIISRISSKAFSDLKQIKTIQFSANSELQVIESYSFFLSSLESIEIPSSIIELKKSWCVGISNLTNIIISPQNPRYSAFNKNKLIIGKSSIDKPNYDSLVFCVRNITKVTIPNFIEIIEPYSFNKCEKLEKVEFHKNSKLRTIEDNAFERCSLLNAIKLPNHLKLICSSSFGICFKLQRVEISENSELQIIENKAFFSCPIKSLFLPSHLTKIGKNAFIFCTKLRIIEMSNRSQLKYVDDIFANICPLLFMVPADSSI